MSEKVTMHRKIAGCLLCRPAVYLMCLWTLCLDTPPSITRGFVIFHASKWRLPAFPLKTEGAHVAENFVMFGLHFVVKAVKY